MTTPVVPGNAFQRTLHENTHSHLRPDGFAEMEMRCLIEKVYDAETLAREGIPEGLGVHLVRHPGYLFARVKLRDGKTKMILPFRKGAGRMLQDYGNALLIEGLPAKIVYRGQPETGRIVVTSNPTQKIAAPQELTGIASIIDIF